EPAAPRASAARHRDRVLLRLRTREELARERVEAVAQPGVDAVTDDREEPDRATRIVDRPRNIPCIPVGTGEQRAPVAAPERHVTCLLLAWSLRAFAPIRSLQPLSLGCQGH